MSAMFEVEQDTTLAIHLMAIRRTATDEEFAKFLRQLLGTCRMEGFRIAIQALKIILQEGKVSEGVAGLQKAVTPPKLDKVVAPQLRSGELKGPVAAKPLQNPITPIQPMRTREDALAVHRKNHPELYNEDGTRKTLQSSAGSGTEDMAELERATRPDTISPEAAKHGYKFVGPTGKARKVDGTGRDDIRRRAKQARLDGLGRYPKGWIKLLAKEYGVSEPLIFQIIYSDPEYEAVIKP